MGKLKVALAQFDTGWHDAEAVVQRVRVRAESASRVGADMLVLPEMATTGFTMDTAQAEPVTGPTGTALQDIARATGVHILAGVATLHQESEGELFTNSAFLFSPGEGVTSEYRKQRLFRLAGEDNSYSPGGGPSTFSINDVRIAPFICYDLRFPELFRAVAHDVDCMILLANWPVKRRAHWDLLVQARAVENLCFMVAVNRTGSGGGAEYNGGSAVYGPWGESLLQCGEDGESVPVIEIDSDRVAAVRERWPFLRDLAHLQPV